MRCPLIGAIYLLAKRIILNINVRTVPILDDYEINENNIPFDVRTFEGSMNNKRKKAMGMSGCPFARNVRPLKNSPGGPDIIHLSKVLLKRRSRAKMSKLVNLLGGAWAQFMVQDWFLHRLDNKKKISFDLGGGEMMNIDAFAKVTYGGEPYNVNSATHWWSCSQIYGYTKEQADKRRSKIDGKLIIDKDGFVPCNESGIEEVGFPRNSWPGISLLHWLFTLEHNRVCSILKTYYPELNTDELLYHKARLIICAMIAKIHVIEWSTAMIQNPLGRASQYFSWYGVLGTFCGSKIKMPWNGFVSSLLDGIPGNSNRFTSRNQSYAHSDEFSAIFRMHSMLPDKLHVRTMAKGFDEHETETTCDFSDFLFENSSKFLHEKGAASLAYTLGMGRTGKIALRNHPTFFDKLKVPSQRGFGVEGESNEYLIDMGAADIFRCREMRLPLFNEFRRQYNLHPYKSFEDFTDEPDLLQALKSAYGGDIERMDTYVGMMGEKKFPGFAFGETIYTIFVLQTQRRLESDRFFTSNFNARTYTAKGLKLIEETTMSEILLRNIKDLDKCLSIDDNAFIPWDITEKRKIHEKVIFDMIFPHFVNNWFKPEQKISTLSRFTPPHMYRSHKFFNDGELHYFSPSSVTFDVVNAWWLSEASFLSYFEEPFFHKQIIHALPSCQIQHIHHKNTEVHVISTNDFIWAIFRGAEWWPRGGACRGENFKPLTEDWTLNFDTHLVQEGEREGVSVHSGFQFALNDIWNELLNAINYAKQGNNEKPVFFAGHSIGGSIAIIAGLRYCYHGKVQGVYTFGAPAVGNSAYLNDYTQRGPMVFNVVNNCDVFSRLLLPKLANPGLCVKIASDGKLSMNEMQRNYEYRGNCESGSLLERLVVDSTVLDHAPIMYTQQLWRQFAV